MLESRSAYGYYGGAGGYTGENAPAADTIPVNMPYREYKKRYPRCKTLGDYDKRDKTITVLLPASVEERPNFGNRYQMSEYVFEVIPDSKMYAPELHQTAKSYENAVKRAKARCKEWGWVFVGDAKGHEKQKNW